MAGNENEFNVNISKKVEDIDTKLEWMYKGTANLLNREEYLLGRSIDKNFEQLDAEEKAQADKNIVGVTVPKNHVEHECIPFSLRYYKSVKTSEQVDLHRKILEDPLMAIKQQEMESRKKILQNPVKLKELHNLLKKEKEKEVIGKKQKRKKKSKRRKKSESCESEEDLDRLLAKKYKNLKNRSADVSLNKLLKVKYENLAKELDESVNREKNSQYFDKTKKRKHKRMEEKRRENRNQHSRKEINYRYNDIRKNNRVNPYSNTNRELNFAAKNELTEEAKAEKLKKMMQNAKWRDDDRATRVKKYREENAEETEKLNKIKFDKKFINRELHKAIDSETTVEARLKSNINNIQRSKTAMESSFAKK